MWREIEPYVALIDEQQLDGVSMTFFEIITAMAYAAFADAPVDVAVVEVGLGGTWDATNVADADVAVITPIDLDHTHLLGNTIAEIATEKAGIIKPGAHAILAGQTSEAAQVLLQRCADVGALPQREGIDFGVIGRQLAVGGQVIRINGGRGPDRRCLPAAVRRPPGGERGPGPRRGGGIPRTEGAQSRHRARGICAGEVPGPAGGGPPLADRGAGRRAQSARRARHRGRGDGGVQFHPAHRRGGGDGRQGRARIARGLRGTDESPGGHPGRLDHAWTARRRTGRTGRGDLRCRAGHRRAAARRRDRTGHLAGRGRRGRSSRRVDHGFGGRRR